MIDTLRFIVPGALDQLTGGYLFDRRVVDGLRMQGRTVEVIELAGRYPDADASAKAAASAALVALPSGSVAVIDGLALPAFVDCLDAESQRLCLIGFIHHPLALETGLSVEAAAHYAQLEARLWKSLNGVICPSPHTARAVIASGVEASRVAIAGPGTAKPSEPIRRQAAGPLQLLAVATVTPRKGHRLLVDALTELRDYDWQLTCIGSLDRDPANVAALREVIAAAGLGERVILRGEQSPTALAAAYRKADFFVLPSYHEGYGMVYAEALAHGLPVIATSAGAIPETVPAAASLLVPPGDVAALRAALQQVFSDTELRARLAARAAQAALELPDWDSAVRRWAAELDRLAMSAASPIEGGFAADWLALREPFDSAARDSDLALRFAAALGARPVKRLLDLGAGTGANFRVLAPLLGGDQDWLLIDHDPLLLAAQIGAIAAWAERAGWRFEIIDNGIVVQTGTARWCVRGQALDLAGALETLSLDAIDGVTTTAFLDLVSAPWLDRLAAWLAGAQRPLLATLTVDGRRIWRPALDSDALVVAAFHSHQGGDKGFGAALGNSAAHYLADRLTARGFATSLARSDWQIGAAHPQMLQHMAAETAAVATAANPAVASTIADWLQRRTEQIVAGAATFTVGHHDLLCLPARSVHAI